MQAALNNDILFHVVSILSEEYHKPDDPRNSYNSTLEHRIDIERAQEARSALLTLRRTCSFLASSITSIFFSTITIDKIDKKQARRLKGIQQSTSIPPVVRTYILKPAIVHTAPVVKSSPFDYYGELQNDCYNHDPRYSTLVAEHEMRQRVKTHWDEQRHFMVPDHGSLPWLARACSRWLLRSPSLGSALHESIFLTALHDFTRLRMLVIGFEEPRTRETVQTVNQDFSIGLAKYLAACGGERLQVLRMQGVWPVDLEILLSTLRDTQAAAATQAPLLPKETEPSHSCPGAWPAVAPHPTSPPASIFSPLWRLQTLDINFSTADDASKTSMTSHLTTLLSYIPSLSTLRLHTDRTFDDRETDPSLVGFRAPALRNLQDIKIACFLVDTAAMASLLAPRKDRSMEIHLICVSLVEGTWAGLIKLIGKDIRFSEGWMVRCGYLGDADKGWRSMDAEERNIWIRAGVRGKIRGIGSQPP